jgi:tripartite-type tricarboxylate transporter receptor subunit TctC
MARWLLQTVLLMLVAAAAGPAWSQSWPQRPIRIVVGFPPGGGIDVVARLLSIPLSETFGQQVIVDNRAGANGIVGTDIVAKSNPDGHTFIGTTGNLSVNPLFPKLPFQHGARLRARHADVAGAVFV